VKNTN